LGQKNELFFKKSLKSKGFASSGASLRMCGQMPW